MASPSPVQCISVGPACPCAAALQRVGLRQAAFPFDWMLSDAQLLDACLTDGFRAFNDVAQYAHGHSTCRVSITAAGRTLLAEGGCDHRTFGEHFFRHHCPLCVPEHHTYLSRATERMMRAVSVPDEVNAVNAVKAAPLVFVWMNIYPRDRDAPGSQEGIRAQLAGLTAVLQRHVAVPWRLLAIECYGGCDHRGTELVHTDPVLTHIRVRGTSVNAGFSYADTHDNAVVDGVLQRASSPNYTFT